VSGHSPYSNPMSKRESTGPVCAFCCKHPTGHEVYECRASIAKQLAESRSLLLQWALVWKRLETDSKPLYDAVAAAIRA
jgi:hypothetical protein